MARTCVLYSSLPKAETLIIGFWKYKECSGSMPLPCIALRRQKQRSCWIDALGSTEAALHFGLSRTCQRTLRMFPSKVHSQGKSYKSTDDCDETYNTETCLSCLVRWSRGWQKFRLLRLRSLRTWQQPGLRAQLEHGVNRLRWFKRKMWWQYFCFWVDPKGTCPGQQVG